MSKQGLWNLSFLELSDNAISEVASDTFVNVTSLRTLRLRDNRLSTGAALAPLYQLEELDFSGNALVGPLEPKSLPAFPRLRTLIFDRNQLSSVRLGALTGLPSLQSLSLRDNQIDVLEDHAFKVKKLLNSHVLHQTSIISPSIIIIWMWKLLRIYYGVTSLYFMSEINALSFSVKPEMTSTSLLFCLRIWKASVFSFPWLKNYVLYTI